jgi:NADH-quinone oxidoreductase subunit H
LGGSISSFGKDIILQATDIDVALLYLIGVMSIGVYGIMIGGWASNNKFSLIGAVRAASQMISRSSHGSSLIALLMMTGTKFTRNLSATVWNELECFLPTIIFSIFNLCVCRNQSTLDLAECETELIGGYHTEYSSMKMGFYLFAEYANMFISSTILAVLFFGGYNYPGMSWAVENWGVNLANIRYRAYYKCGFIFLYMWVRWTIQDLDTIS